MLTHSFSILLALTFLLMLPAHAAEKSVSFSRDLAPILADKCLECHREKKAKGRYRVDTFEQLLKAGDSKDKPLTAGKTETSALYARLVSKDDDERMPQKDDPLPAAQIALFKQWIEQGAKFDGGDAKTPITDLLAAKSKPVAPQKYPQPLAVTALAMSADGQHLFTSGYHELLEWDVSNGTLIRRLPEMPERVLALDVAKGKPWIVVAGGTPGRSGEVLIVDSKSGKVQRTLLRAKDTVLAARFNADATVLAVGGTDNTVRVFRTSDWKQAWSAEAHADWITSLTFSADGKHLASTSRDRTARLYEPTKGRIEHTYSLHLSAVNCAAFDAESQWLFTGAVDGEVRRWFIGDDASKEDKEKKKKSGEVLKSKRQEVTAMAVIFDSLFTASADGRVRTYDLSKPGTPKEIDAFGARVDAMAVNEAQLPITVPRSNGAAVRLTLAGHGGELRVQLIGDQKSVLKWIAAPGWEKSGEHKKP